MIRCENVNGNWVLFFVKTICRVVEIDQKYCDVYTSDGEVTTVKCSFEIFYKKLLDEMK